MKKEELQAIAQVEGLQVVPTTTGINGYPRNEGWALAGFETWEQAERVSSEHGLTLIWGYKKDGWSHWSATFSDTAHGPLSVRDVFDNATFYDSFEEYKKQLAEDINEDVELLRGEDASEEEIAEYIATKNKENEYNLSVLKAECDNYKEGQYVVVVIDGYVKGAYPKQMTGYYYDTEHRQVLAAEPNENAY